MRKLLLKSILLLCFLIIESMNLRAEDVEIFNVAGGGNVPTGWTLVGDNMADHWILLAGGTDYIQTSAYDVSAYNKVTIAAQVATYKSGTSPHAKIEISYDGGNTFNETTIQGNPTSASYVNVSYELLSTSRNVVIKVSNSITSGRGLRFKNFKLTGTYNNKTNAELVAIEDFEMFRDTEKNAEDLFTITSTGLVSYESNNEDVARVADGKLKALAIGTATITISSAANDDYNAGSDAVIVTVKNRDAVTPEGADAGDFTKIFSIAELTDDDYLIVCESENVAFNGNLSTLDATNNYINITISNNTIAPTTEINNAIFTYNTTEKTLLSKSGKYIGRSVNSNGLDACTTALTNYISFQGTGDAVIESPMGPALQYNNKSGQTRFRYYTGTQKYVQLYKRSAATTYDITIGATGYKTLISAVSATLPFGVSAYKAVSTDEGKIQLTSVTSIKAGNAYILKGTTGNHTLTITDTPEEPTGNILEVSTENTSNGVYVLANGSQGVGFYKWTGGSLGAGRAIVPASAVNSKTREFLGFDFSEETTTIENIKIQKTDRQFFNLAGQRVTQPTKGLYIVNGQKIVVK